MLRLAGVLVLYCVCCIIQGATILPNGASSKQEEDAVDTRVRDSHHNRRSTGSRWTTENYWDTTRRWGTGGNPWRPMTSYSPWRTTGDHLRTMTPAPWRTTRGWWEGSTNHVRTSTPDYGCFSILCMNGGYCVNDCLGEFYCCQCPRHFAGRYCEKQVLFCHSNPCLNGGTCRENGTSFLCNCAEGYDGRMCEEEKPTVPPRKDDSPLEYQKLQILNFERVKISPNARNGSTIMESIWDFIGSLKKKLHL